MNNILFALIMLTMVGIGIGIGYLYTFNTANLDISTQCNKFIMDYCYCSPIKKDMNMPNSMPQFNISWRIKDGK